MLFNVKGTLAFKGEIKRGTSAKGTAWQNADIIVDVPGYNGRVDKVVLRISGDTVNDFVPLGIGTKLDISFSINAHEWNGRWFNDLEVWKVTAEAAPAPAPEPQPAPAPAKKAAAAPVDDNPSDDLPF